MSDNLKMMARYAVSGAVMYALGKGWLTPEQAGPVTDAVMLLAGIALAAIPPAWAWFKVDNTPKS